MPPRYSQENRAFRVSVGSLGEDVLLLDGFACNSRVSEPFQLTLQLLSENDSVDPASVLRGPFLLSMSLPDGSDRYVHGFCNRFAQRGKNEDLTSYEAEVVPWLWFLSLNQDCHIFQEMTVLEILEEIFGKYGQAEYEIRCIESYPSREYCVQYRESDLDFVSRLMEEEGLFYFFEHSDEGHKLIVADDSSAIRECEGQEVFRVATTPGAREDEDVIEELEREHQVYTTQVTLTDYDPLQPSLNLASSASDETHEELYDFPGRYERLPDGERYALIRLQERAAAQQMVRGNGKCRSFRSGYRFPLTQHYRADTNQSYLLLSVWESGDNGGYRSQAGEAEYSNNFQCVPADIQYRPSRRTPKPVVHGSQTAIVVGPSGEEIYTDSHGRVKVQFHWDRKGKRDENSSCWIRVSHPWAGKGWGAVALPRMGQEVIVDFLEGDPDRPIITGRVYNAEQTPPYELPGKQTQSGLKSRSSKGGSTSNFNEIRMEDKKGSEQLYIHAEKDKQVVVENNRTESVGNDETISIGNDRKETVGNNESISIGGNQSISVGGSRSESVGKDESVSIGSNRSHSVEKNHSLDVGGDRSESIAKKDNLSVGDSRSARVGKDDQLQVGKKLVIDAGDQIVLKSGKASIVMKKDGTITIKGKDINLTGSGKINVKASSDVTIKGSKVKQN